MVLLEGGQRVVLLSIIWSVAVLGVLFKVFWIGAPKWLYMPIYIGMGWAAVFYIPSFAAGSIRLGVGIGTAILVLIAAGGALYTLGGVVYSIKRLLDPETKAPLKWRAGNIKELRTPDPYTVEYELERELRDALRAATP